MRNIIFRSAVSALLMIGLFPFSAVAAENLNREQKIRTFNEKTLYYQKGFFFAPDKVIQGYQEYTVGGEELYRVLSAYPSSASEIDNYRTTSIAGAILLGSGVLVFFGGLFIPKFMTSEDTALINILTATAVISGAVLGLGGLWLMNSDIKQNFLYRSIWYYNESVLFEDNAPGTGLKELKFNLFSWLREF